MKIFLFALLFLFPVSIQAATLTWQDNSNTESGFAIEQLQGGVFVEIARVAANVTTYSDKNTEGVYRVRAFLTIPNQPEVFSNYSNTGAALNAPVSLFVK